MLRGFSMGARLLALLGGILLIGLLFVYTNRERPIQDKIKEPKTHEQDTLQKQIDDVLIQFDLK